MAESSTSTSTTSEVLVVVLLIAVIGLIAYILFFSKRSSGTTVPTPAPTYTPPPSTPTPTPTPAPSGSPIQVQQFVITNDCSGSYCWGMIQFSSSITGTLTKVTTNYSNGQSYAWQGNYNVQQGTNTIWLDDFLPCNHLGCNPPGQIVSLTFTINGQNYTVPVTPTTGNPLAQTPPSQSQIFIGSG